MNTLRLAFVSARPPGHRLRAGPLSALRRIRWGYLVALLPVATDWIDTGHLPHHLRELVTEVIVGLIFAGLIHALYRSADRFRALSETDPLTGLLNRRRLEDDLAREIRRAEKSPLAVAFADLDAFKEINDTRGHAAGDEVLRTVAQALRSALRRGGCAYRVGGDEFAVVFPCASAVEARETLREALVACNDLARDGVTLSVGIEELRAREGVRSLLERADAAMYKMKSSGRRSRAADHEATPLQLRGQEPRVR